MFVVGKMDGLMVVSGRRHNAGDIVAFGCGAHEICLQGKVGVLCVWYGSPQATLFI